MTAGILLMLLAWALFALVDTAVKWLVLAGVPALFLVFVRYALAFGLSLISAWTKGPIPWPLGRALWTILVIRALLLGTTTAVNFFVLKFLSLTVTSAILFSAPILVCAISALFLGERIGPWRWGAIILGFAGVLLVLRPFGETFHPAAVLVLYNATSLALFSILTRRISGQVPSDVQQITVNGIGMGLALPFLPWTWTPPASLTQGLLYLLVGCAAWAGHEAFSRAHLYGNASLLMPFSYSFLIYLTGTSWLVFGDLPDLPTLAGALVIAASGLLIWWRERGGSAA